MITILICSLIAFANALENQDGAEEEIKAILTKYIEGIPDIEEKYVVNEGLAKSISKYYGGKISALPLFKINLKIDRQPVKIPWTVGNPTEQLAEVNQDEKGQREAPKFRIVGRKLRPRKKRNKNKAYNSR